MIALGGAWAALFNALVAPVLFTWVGGIPAGPGDGGAAGPGRGAVPGPRGPRGRAGLLLDVVLPLLLGAAAYLAPAPLGRRPPSLAPARPAGRVPPVRPRARSGSRWAWRSSRW